MMALALIQAEATEPSTTALVIGGVVMAFALFLGLIRNTWVLVVGIRHINRAHEWHQAQIAAARHGLIPAPDVNLSGYDCIAGYTEMLLRFWRWRLRDFVTDPPTFAALYGSGPAWPTATTAKKARS